IALIRHRPKKRNGAPRQKPKHNHPTTDPLVNPGNPPHCYQTCAEADSTRTHHRMVLLAQSSPGCRSTRPLQIKKATVMLTLSIFSGEDHPSPNQRGKTHRDLSKGEAGTEPRGKRCPWAFSNLVVQ
ncbi:MULTISPECIES: hypothetical protein, partial [unclassified Bradyrhizobium]|uniref:hypothetical protein n=1 Tax=unclassified Bradyrhizobium TaxID=2631580 RepID=UPI001FFA2B83